MLCIERIFKDNEHYNDVFGDIGNAYVKAIGWLFTDKAYKDERNDYCLRGVMNTPEFMSCVHYFVFAATGSQPRLTINDYVTQLRTGDKRNRYNPYLDKNKVAIQKHEGKDVITFSHIEQNIIEVLLWSAYIYWHICSALYKDDKESKRAKKAILIAFEEHSYLTKDTFKEHFLVKEIGSTIKRFVKFGTENAETEEAASLNNTETTIDSDEIMKLKNQVEELESQVADLKTLLAGYEEEAISTDPKDKVKFEIMRQLLINAGVDFNKYGNKLAAARIIAYVCGLEKPNYPNNYLVTPEIRIDEHEEDIEKLNSDLKKIGTKIQIGQQ